MTAQTPFNDFEELLRETLTAKALTLDPTAEARLASNDYGAVARRRRVRHIFTLAASGAVACVLAVAIALAVRGVGNNPTTAEASWSPVPTELPANRLAAAANGCFLGPPSLQKSMRKAGILPKASLGDGTFTYEPTLGEIRGSTQAFVAVAKPVGGKKAMRQWGVDATHSLVAICFSGAGGGVSTDQREPTHVAPNAIQFTAVGLELSAQAGATTMAGRVGRNVKAVWLTDVRGGLPTIRATVRDGFYLVWWPATENPQYIVIQTRHGIHSELLPASDRTEHTLPSTPKSSGGTATASAGVWANP